MGHYDKSYTRNGHTIAITATMSTGVDPTNPDSSANTHTISVVFDGVTSSYAGIKTEDLSNQLSKLETSMNQLADGIVDPDLDAALLSNGYTYTP